MAAPPSKSSYADYTVEKERCIEFLTTFREPGATEPKYAELLQHVANREQRIVQIEMDDVMLWQGDRDFVQRIETNAKRYVEVFAQAIDECLPEPSRVIPDEDTVDVLLSQRQQHARNADDDQDGTQQPVRFPPRLMRRYEVVLVPRDEQPELAIRDIKAEHIGRLVKVRSMVSRASDVKPLLTVATYTCDACGVEVYQEVNSRTFMPITTCPATTCINNKTQYRIYMQTRGSKFIKHQDIKVQELPEQVPVGHIPRSMTIVARGEATRQVLPGDEVVIAGIFLPTPYTGYKAIRAGLIADTYLEAHAISKAKKSYAETNFDDETQELIKDASRDPGITTKLARSIAPEIYGMEDVKKALLLQLVGGVTRNQKDGMRIRGDINVLLMGDPGVAKSQLLKHISSVAPRGVYTTGKGSSGVGLTAAVVKDPMTGETTLEGGALVMADMGIACIDEFDKMDESDRTAIYEVMEQQTVSIAKAGITTTLNARTSMLAAANPLYGRYNPNIVRNDPHANLLKNINLPAALLSRFDLVFLLLDRADSDRDKALAEHVTYVHQNSRHPALDFTPLSPAFIRAYISAARHVTPVVPPSLRDHIVETYVAMRADEVDAANRGQTVITARQLLSILRMSQALSRLRFLDKVEETDVDEAIRLIRMSKASLSEEDANTGREDVISRIYTLIHQHAQAHDQVVNLADIERKVIAKGFKKAQFEACLEHYSELDIWQFNASRTEIQFVG